MPVLEDISTRHCIVEQDGPVVTLTMNRPEKRNALSADMLVGHNIRRFDLRVVAAQASRHGLTFTPTATADTLDLIRRMNETDLAPDDTELAARIATYELAFRMQQHAPEAVDLSRETATTRTAYGLFRAWIQSKDGGAAVDAKIQAGFDELDAAYSTLSGDAFPALPPNFSAESPTDADKATDFGKLFVRVQEAVDPNRKDSVVDGMNQAAVLLNFPEFIAE